MSEKIDDKSIALIIGVLIFCLLIVVSVSAWTGPSGAPPGSNAPEPINISSSGQEKEGQVGVAIPSGESLDAGYGLTVGTVSNPLGIKTDGDSYFNGDIDITGKANATELCINTVCQSDWGSVSGVGGGGTQNYAAKFTSSDTVGNSQIFDNGSSVGIGIATPSYKLHAAGDIYADGGWLRTNGSRGWYNETYGGGMYMSDSTWLRTYSNKSIYSGTGIIRSDASVRAPIFYDQNNTSYYVDPTGTSNLYNIEAYGAIDANQNYIYGQRCCWNVVVDAIGGYSNTPKGYCWDALGAYYSPVAVSCQNVQEVTSLPNACNSSGDDHCYFFSNEAGVVNVCDYSTGGDAVISCCKTTGICGETP